MLLSSCIQTSAIACGAADFDLGASLLVWIEPCFFSYPSPSAQILPIVKTCQNDVGSEIVCYSLVHVRYLLYRRGSCTPGPGIWKQHLHQNRAKLINQIDMRTFKQHVLAKKVPKHPKKSQVPSLTKKSNHVQSLASPDTKINEDALGEEVPWKRLFKIIFNQGQEKCAARRVTTQVSIKNSIHIVSNSFCSNLIQA